MKERYFWPIPVMLGEAVTQALVAYVQHLEQEQIVSLFGAVEYDAAYDYKRQRARR